MSKKQHTKTAEELSQQEIESMEMLQQIHKKTGHQLTINTETGRLDEIDELQTIINKDFENPEEKYDVYYRGIRKLLMDHLPKGKDFEVARQIIYDEKNIFLNAGNRKSDNSGIRKSDGRMTYQPVMNEILDVVVKWVAESRNAFQLYRLFYELNEKHGYGHEVYDDSTRSIANAMKTLSETT
jgi:hypothetical protein